MRRKIFVIFTLIVCAFFILSACGRNRDNDSEREQVNNGGGVAGVHISPYTQILNIAMPIRHEQRFLQTAENLRQVLAGQGVDFRAEITSYVDDERDAFFDLMLSKYAAGVGPDLFVLDGFPLYRFVENDFLADINTLIDGYGNRDDFFANVLESVEIRGNLYHFPMDFTFSYIGINANVPYEFISRFAALDRASPSELFEIYADLLEAHPEWGDFAFVNGLTAQEAFVPEIGHNMIFDGTIETRTELLMEDIRDIFWDNERFNTHIPFDKTDEEMEMLQERYVFSRAFGWTAEMDALFNFEQANPWFMHYIPIADERGQLVSRVSTMNICVSQTANGALAWAFIEQLARDAAMENPRSMNMPIVRQYFRQGMESGFGLRLTHAQPRHNAGNVSGAVEYAITRMYEYSTWPVVIPLVNFLIMPESFTSHFNIFMGSEIAAESSIASIQNGIRIWLNATRRIQPFVPEPEDVDDGIERTVRTLSIYTNDSHTGVFLQAAEALNASWRERGEPYILELVIEDYHWNEFYEWEYRGPRLQTRLMAGQGPDIFVMGDYMDVHAFARSGLVVDFNELINNCPYTGRDAFFNDALAAFESFGGLYVLPMSFGFYYIGINANLPQPFLDRFAQKSYVTIYELLEIYWDLMYDHRDEFGHLLPGVPRPYMSSAGLVGNAMNEFIDFNARTADLMNPRFLALMEEIPQLFENREYFHIGQAWGIGGVTSWFFLRDRAQEVVFIPESTDLHSVNAFFTPEDPHFLHYTPLVDYYGRMILNSGSFANTWARLAMPISADRDLAWELIRYLIPAYSQPEGRARICGTWGIENTWRTTSLATPILRPLAEDHTRLAFERAFATREIQDFVGHDNPAERNRQMEAAIDRIAAYNEMPMSLIYSHVPTHLFQEPLEQMMLGIITPQAAAQRMHNSISLWLIE